MSSCRNLTVIRQPCSAAHAAVLGRSARSALVPSSQSTVDRPRYIPHAQWSSVLPVPVTPHSLIPLGTGRESISSTVASNSERAATAFFANRSSDLSCSSSALQIFLYCKNSCGRKIEREGDDARILWKIQSKANECLNSNTNTPSHSSSKCSSCSRGHSVYSQLLVRMMIAPPEPQLAN